MDATPSAWFQSFLHKVISVSKSLSQQRDEQDVSDDAVFASLRLSNSQAFHPTLERFLRSHLHPCLPVTVLRHRPSNAALCRVPIGLASQQDSETRSCRWWSGAAVTMVTGSVQKNRSRQTLLARLDTQVGLPPASLSVVTVFIAVSNKTWPWNTFPCNSNLL